MDSTALWFLIGAVLVFFMQCGFAMVETGFTRAKNAGNIIMKNLMDFCIATDSFRKERFYAVKVIAIKSPGFLVPILRFFFGIGRKKGGK